MLRVGLTGGIACGKSHVLARLAEAGCHTIDLDRLAHELMAPGQPAHAEIVTSFGNGVLRPDGAIDRKRLGATVFADEAARQRLNAIVHPRVRAEEARRVGALARDPGTVVVTDAALLIEAGAHLRFDRLLVVHCAPEEQVRRLMQRDGIARAAAEVRIGAQMEVRCKRQFAHLEVDTSGSLEETRAVADRVANELKRLAQERPPRCRVAGERVLGCLAQGNPSDPTGLTPLRLLEDLLEAQGPEMRRIAALAGRPPSRPWYEADLELGPMTATLTPPLVLWALANRGEDHEFIASAAASLARVVSRDPASISDASLFSLALSGVLSGRLALSDAGPEALQRRSLAERWSGAEVTPGMLAALAAAGRHPGDGEAAARDLAGRPELLEIARILVGAADGLAAEAVSPALREAVARFEAMNP